VKKIQYILILIFCLNTNAYANKYNKYFIDTDEKTSIKKISYFHLKEKKSFFQLLNYFSIESVKRKKEKRGSDIIFWIKYNFYN